jgi:hypothetical protein
MTGPATIWAIATSTSVHESLRTLNWPTCNQPFHQWAVAKSLARPLARRCNRTVAPYLGSGEGRIRVSPNWRGEHAALIAIRTTNSAFTLVPVRDPSIPSLPGGACTHWKAPPCHGAHVKRTLQISTADVADAA